MEIHDALFWAAQRKNGTLITLRRDGRAQSSDIAYAVVHKEIKISVTHDRAKTRNIMRDPRVVLHISEPSSWSYVSIDAIATLAPVAADPDDATVDELVELYETIVGEHDDWGEFRRAMVDDGRLAVRLEPRSVTGQIN